VEAEGLLEPVDEQAAKTKSDANKMLPRWIARPGRDRVFKFLFLVGEIATQAPRSFERMAGLRLSVVELT